LKGLDLDELTSPCFDTRLRVPDEPFLPLELFTLFGKRLLALAKVSFLRGQLRRAFVDLLPEGRDAGAAILKLGSPLARGLLAAPLALGERLPGSLQLGASLGHV
jgi:hypothetical protein